MPTRALILLLALGPVGCRRLDPAPDDVDGLLHYLWQRADAGEDEALTEGVLNLHDAVDGDGWTEVIEGLVSDLTDDEVAEFGRDVDPAEATGGFVVNRIPCTLDELEAVLVYEDQASLREGTYDTYTREMASPADDYLSGTSDRLGWDTTFHVSALGIGYEAESRTTMRRVTEVQTPDGPALVLRVHLLDDAVFDNPDSNNHIRQNYQLEVYWPDGDAMLHTYATWADTRMLGFEDEGEQSQRLQLNNLADWGDETGELCEAGLP